MPPRPLYFDPLLAIFLALGVPSVFLPIGPPIDWWFAHPDLFAVLLLGFAAAMWGLRTGKRGPHATLVYGGVTLAGAWALLRAAPDGPPGLLEGAGFYGWALALELLALRAVTLLIERCRG